MRAIITGGTGLIGRALAADLAADGHDVIVLGRSPARVTGLPQGVRAQGWDARSAKGWGNLADGADAIVNLVGESLASGRWTAERKQRIRESRISGGLAVVDAVRAAAKKPQVVVQSSGIGYYGPRGDEQITEEDTAGGDFLAQVCVDWENSTAALDGMGIRRPIIRSAVVFSNDALAFKRMVLPFKLFVGGPVGGGKQWLPWIHVADEVGAVRFLIEHPEANGPFNLCAPEPVTNCDFGRTLGTVIHRPSIMPLPGFALRAVFGELAAVLLDGQRAVPERLLQLGYTFRFPKLVDALQDLFE
jgi:uncharacterized protein (TIGR01777 family)